MRVRCNAMHEGSVRRQRLEACRGVGLLVVVCGVSLVAVYVSVCVYSSSNNSSEGVGAGGWRGEGVLLWVMNSVAGCGS